MRPALLLLVSAAFAAAQEAQPVVPTLALSDQFDRPHDLKELRGSVVVLIYGDKASAKANGDLGERVHVEFHPSARGKAVAEAHRAPVRALPGAATSPEVVAVPVACIGKIPLPLVVRLVKNQIAGGSPVVPVWLDFGEQMKSQFPFQAGVPNVVVIDAQGRYRYAAAGTPTAQGAVKLMGVIEGLRKEAAESR